MQVSGLKLMVLEPGATHTATASVLNHWDEISVVCSGITDIWVFYNSAST